MATAIQYPPGAAVPQQGTAQPISATGATKATGTAPAGAPAAAGASAPNVAQAADQNASAGEKALAFLNGNTQKSEGHHKGHHHKAKGAGEPATQNDDTTPTNPLTAAALQAQSGSQKV